MITEEELNEFLETVDRPVHRGTNVARIVRTLVREVLSLQDPEQCEADHGGFTISTVKECPGCGHDVELAIEFPVLDCCRTVHYDEDDDLDNG